MQPQPFDQALLERALATLAIQGFDTAEIHALEALLAAGVIARGESATTELHRQLAELREQMARREDPIVQHRIERFIEGLIAPAWVDVTERIRELEAELARRANFDESSGASESSEDRQFRYVAEVTRRVFELLLGRSASYAERGRAFADVADPADLAELMVSAVPAPSPWDDAIGPFYTSPQVARLLGGISRQALADRRRRRSLLALRTDDDRWVYPVAQFRPDGRVIDGLGETIRAFKPADVDEWTVAGWLFAPSRALGELSPIGWLRDRRSIERVVELARGAAARFAA